MPTPTVGDDADDFSPDREYARDLDDADPLADLRERFFVPEDERYMDGNSLGLCSEDAAAALDQVVEEWKELAIRGWTDADPDWFHYGERLGDRIAPLVGARESEVVVGNSTTVNIHTLVGTMLDAHDGETVLVNDLDFPTDHYAIAAQLRQRGLDPDEHLLRVESEDGRTITADAVETALETHDVDIVFMPTVLYRSGQLLDVEAITELAHEHDALAGFDAAHSVGVVPHEFDEVGVDFAVWCTYKYLNAGPGAIAGLYVNERHFDAEPALAGWWGHDKATQFEMNHAFTPADDAGAWQIGTIPVLAAAPLDGALDVTHDAGIEALREKSVLLTDYLIRLADERLVDLGYAVGTPRDPERRGGHVAIEHEEAYRISQALKERGVVVDYRPPNVVRVAPSPYYVGFEEVWTVVEDLHDIAANELFREYEPQSGGVT
ncbi:kynureninase [Haloarchaeobius amylolyticus]|uniref:kynureninase n=1 Tax=Haloarchaeobius amylolyticus TaxID=1198296 RepID=UPI00226ED88F|nr:kynureninase [Haloarchaeobius amylolyticus]